MALTIAPYTAEHASAVAAFNERMRAHDGPFGLSKTPIADWLPKTDGAVVFREFFLALDDAEVRGGFTLRRQDFWLRGQQMVVANYQGPISEGLWDRRHMMAGVQMLRAALRDQPLLYALGMGGLTQPLPKLLASSGWALAPVPFRFCVLQPANFLRQIRPLRRVPWRARVLDIAAATGLGWLGFTAMHAWRSRKRLEPGWTCERVSEFGPWADEVWAQARDDYAFSAIRDRNAQNALFAKSSDRNLILRCTREGRDLGWAVVRSTPMKDDQYFGNLRLGSLVDALAVRGEEFSVLALAIRHLRELGSDLVVTNQSHVRWLEAARDDGWIEGPSNFIFAASPKLVEALGSLDSALSTIHINRADGDGPIHL